MIENVFFRLIFLEETIFTHVRTCFITQSMFKKCSRMCYVCVVWLLGVTFCQPQNNRRYCIGVKSQTVKEVQTERMMLMQSSRVESVGELNIFCLDWLPGSAVCPQRVSKHKHTLTWNVAVCLLPKTLLLAPAWAARTRRPSSQYDCVTVEPVFFSEEAHLINLRRLWKRGWRTGVRLPATESELSAEESRLLGAWAILEMCEAQVVAQAVYDQYSFSIASSSSSSSSSPLGSFNLMFMFVYML